MKERYIPYYKQERKDQMKERKGINNVLSVYREIPQILRGYGIP